MMTPKVSKKPLSFLEKIKIKSHNSNNFNREKPLTDSTSGYSDNLN